VLEGLMSVAQHVQLTHRKQHTEARAEPHDGHCPMALALALMGLHIPDEDVFTAYLETEDIGRDEETNMQWLTLSHLEAMGVHVLSPRTVTERVNALLFALKVAILAHLKITHGNAAALQLGDLNGGILMQHLAALAPRLRAFDFPSLENNVMRTSVAGGTAYTFPDSSKTLTLRGLCDAVNSMKSALCGIFAEILQPGAEEQGGGDSPDDEQARAFAFVRRLVMSGISDTSMLQLAQSAEGIVATGSAVEALRAASLAMARRDEASLREKVGRFRDLLVLLLPVTCMLDLRACVWPASA